MCEKCGCGPAAKHGRAELELVRGILDANEREAEHNRDHFDAHGVVAINLMSAPGSGKTSLLEATIPRLRGKLRVAVVEGDLETENDARRIRAQGVPAVQITTGTACHLDAALIHEALHSLDLNEVDVLFIENIGNLVCPASFGLGQHRNVTLLSVTEGDDKPAKYPVMFRASDLVLLTKTDLLPHLDDFQPERAQAALSSIGVHAPLLQLSTRAPASIDAWIEWLEHVVRDVRAHQVGASHGRSPERQVHDHHRG